MAIDTNDKEFINTALDKLINRQNLADTNDDKEFLLHLYDQLWENMRAKENRLWSFLALYGAAVGLVFAGGQTSQTAGADIFALIIVLALSTWAVLIILNANWWVRRNLLMVGGIEDRFKEIKAGIYPKQFPDSKGGFDVLYRGSILVLSVLLIILYARTTWSYRNGGAVNAFHILAGITIVYLLFAGSALYCLLLHESYVRLLHKTRRSIAERAEKLTPAKKLELFQSEVDERRKLSARPHVIIILVIAAGLFDFVLYTNGLAFIPGDRLGLWIVMSLQLFLFVVYGVLWLRYRRPFSSKCFYSTAQKLIGEESSAAKAFIDQSGALIASANIQEQFNKRVQSLEDLSGLFEKLRDPRSAETITLIEAFQTDLRTVAEVVKAGVRSTEETNVAKGLKKIADDLSPITVNKLSWPSERGEDCKGEQVKERLKVMDEGLESFDRKRWLWVLALVTLTSAIFPVISLSSTTTAKADITRKGNAPSTADVRAQADEAEALLRKLKETQAKLETIEAQQTQQLTIKREIDEAMKNFVTKEGLQEQLDKDRKAK
jgi:hypothetical protein